MFHYNINLIKNATNKFKKVFYFSKVKSTNEMAKKLIQKSKLNGNAVIISNNKMEAEKSFDFPHKNTNVHMSVVIKNINLDLKLLSIILPLAVANAIDKISGLKTSIRWPNYILIDEKMVSKIKVEHFEGNSLIAAGDEDLIKIHFHTNEPWKVLEYCASLGESYDIVVEDMDRQARGLKG